MLSEADHRRLCEIEARLRAEDPTFVEAFDSGRRRRSRPGRAVLVAVVLTAATAGIGVVAGGAGVAAAVAAICAGAGIWVTHIQGR